MTMVRFLLEYTIETICKGSKSECARRLGFEYAELRKFRKRISECGSSNRVTEALLIMYWRDELSIDDVLKEYTKTYMGADIEEAEKVCHDYVRSVSKIITSNKRGSVSATRLMNAARSFAQQLDQYFCQDICMRKRYVEKDCPLKSFSHFLDSLQQEITHMEDE